MAQNGELKEINGSWLVRYYEGKTRRMKKLGRVSDYPTRDDIFPVYQQYMADVNRKDFKPEIGTLLRTFVTEFYFPRVTGNLRGSTLRGYKAIWRNYLEPRLGHLRLADIHVFECQKAMDSIIRDNPKLKQASLTRIKSFLHKVFKIAISQGLHRGNADGKNFVHGIEIQCAKGNKPNETFAYSLDEIKNILASLSGTAKVLLAIAAYTGLRRGEIVGLKWEDYDGEIISVRRNICFGEKGQMTVEEPKTEASKAAVPVIPSLREILDEWKARSEVTAGCWMFPAGFTRKEDHPETLLDAAKLTPLSPANILRDVILSALEKAEIKWLGYHAFRRGLATNLHALGVEDMIIMQILRHSDVAVTRGSYIKTVPALSVEAMGKIEAMLKAKSAAPPLKMTKQIDVVMPTSIA